MKRLLPSFLTLLLASLGAHAAPTSAYSEAVINASPAQTWQALTTKEGMESWMVAKAEVDFRIGGLLRTRYAADGVIGDDGTIDNLLLSYDPQRMYSMRIAKPPKGFPFSQAWKSVWSVVYFENAGPAGTKVSIHMLGYTDDEESQKMREFFQRGNQYTLDRLAAKFKPPETATGTTVPGK